MNEEFKKETEVRKPSVGYLIFAIIATIFGCCSSYGVGMLLGVIAIVFTVLANNKFKNGDYYNMQKFVKISRAFSIASILTFVLTFAYAFYDINKNPEKYKEVFDKIEKQMEEIQKKSEAEKLK